MLSAAGSASAGRKGWPPQRRSTGSAGAFTTTTSQASVALRSLSPAFNWSATAVLPSVVLSSIVVTLGSQGTKGDPILPVRCAPHRDGGVLRARPGGTYGRADRTDSCFGLGGAAWPEGRRRRATRRPAPAGPT